MSEIGPLLIVKSDGSMERFSESKLRRCFQAVLRETGKETHLAEPLARAVAMHLQEGPLPELLNSDYLARCVRAALEQTGLEDSAEAYVAHRRQRKALRKRLRIFDPSQPQRSAAPWKKSSVVGTLIKDFGLRRSVARTLAGEIEQRVMDLGYRVVRTPLLAELVRNELMTWGLADELASGSSAELWSKPVASRWPARED